MKILTMLSVIGLVTGCGFTQDKNPASSSGTPTTSTSAPTGTAPPVGTTTTPTYTNVNSQILQPGCTGCHSGSSPSGGIDLSTYSGVMAVVSAGSPSGSQIYSAVSGGVMPPAGALPQADVALIDSWITAGALNN